MTRRTRTIKRVVVVVGSVILVLVAVGVIVGVAQASSSTVRPHCRADPAPAIAALPAGGTFNGTGHCYHTSGIVVLEPNITIDGGTYHDAVAARPIKPIIRAVDTSDFKVENVTLDGSNTNGGYHPNLVNQAGVDLRSVQGVTIENVSTDQTQGDGLTFGWDPEPHHGGPDTNVVVKGLTVTTAGRQGMTPADISNGTFSNIDIVSTADDGLDFESDVGSIGDGTLTFDDVTTKTINIIETIHSVTFTKTSTRGRFIDQGGVRSVVDYSGSFLCQRAAPIPGCVTVEGGTLNLAPGTTFAHVPGKDETHGALYGDHRIRRHPSPVKAMGVDGEPACRRDSVHPPRRVGWPSI